MSREINANVISKINMNSSTGVCGSFVKYQPCVKLSDLGHPNSNRDGVSNELGEDRSDFRRLSLGLQMWTSVLQVTNVIAVPRVTIQMDHTIVSVTAATQETDAPVEV